MAVNKALYYGFVCLGPITWYVLLCLSCTMLMHAVCKQHACQTQAVANITTISWCVMLLILNQSFTLQIRFCAVVSGQYSKGSTCVASKMAQRRQLPGQQVWL